MPIKYNRWFTSSGSNALYSFLFLLALYIQWEGGWRFFVFLFYSIKIIILHNSPWFLYVQQAITFSSFLTDVCVVGVARTPMGAFLGALSSLPATKLGSIAIEGHIQIIILSKLLTRRIYFAPMIALT